MCSFDGLIAPAYSFSTWKAIIGPPLTDWEEIIKFQQDHYIHVHAVTCGTSY